MLDWIDSSRAAPHWKQQKHQWCQPPSCIASHAEQQQQLPRTHPADTKVGQLGAALSIKQDVLKGQRAGVHASSVKLRGRKAAVAHHARRVVLLRDAPNRTCRSMPTAPPPASLAKKQSSFDVTWRQLRYDHVTPPHLRLEVAVHHRGVQVGQPRSHIVRQLRHGLRAGRGGRVVGRQAGLAEPGRPQPSIAIQPECPAFPVGGSVFQAPPLAPFAEQRPPTCRTSR